MVMVVSGAKKAAWRQWCTQQVMSRSVEGKSMRRHASCMLHVPSGPPGGVLKPAPSQEPGARQPGIRAHEPAPCADRQIVRIAESQLRLRDSYGVNSVRGRS